MCEAHHLAQEVNSRSGLSDADVRFNLCYRHKHIEHTAETIPLRHFPSHYYNYVTAAATTHERTRLSLIDTLSHRLQLSLAIVQNHTLKIACKVAATRDGFPHRADADCLRALRQSEGKV